MSNTSCIEGIRVSPDPLDAVFIKADLSIAGTCPNLSPSDITPGTTCYYNYTKQNPSDPYIVRGAQGPLSIVDCFCVADLDPNSQSTIRTADDGTTYYLAPPVDAGRVTNVEYFTTPAPGQNCTSFPNGPVDCFNNKPDHYCRTPGGQIEGLACNPENSIGSKFGGCVPIPGGGSLQGWQCVPATWNCVILGGSRACEIATDNKGTYTSRAACLAANCENCADKNFCNGRGTCINNLCWCTGGFGGPTCACPPRGVPCAGQRCDWEDYNTLQTCGNPCDTFCSASTGQGCLCGCSGSECNLCVGSPCR